MDDIDLIYQNEFGIAFQWKPGLTKKIEKIQLIFRDIVLLLTPNELHYFSQCIIKALQNGKGNFCEDCKAKGTCRTLLLNSPAYQVTFAVSYHELLEIQDLVKGTLFQLRLVSFFDEIGIG